MATEKTPSRGSRLLRAWREEKGISQNDAASLIGVDFVQLSKYERGVARPGLDRAVRIQDVTRGLVPVESWADSEIADEKAAS